MQDFKSESFEMVGDHSQMVKVPTITSDYGLKDCVNLSPSTAVSRLNLSSYQFDLPQELIAQYPCSPRDQSRLMIVDRSTGNTQEIVFRELYDMLNPGDDLVFNDTKVIPARLLGNRDSGGKAEVFLTRRHLDGTWEALVRPGRKMRVGTKVVFGEDFACEVIDLYEDGTRRVRFLCDGNFETLLWKYGQIPLPQYIRRDVDLSVDAERYQTVYASSSGALAAPTAGLHFTKEMLERLTEKGVGQSTVTLHIGLGTFRPVQVENILDHKMHTEHVIISKSASEHLNKRSLDRRQICVGTTSCRALEAAASAEGVIPAGEFETNIFIYPGYRFKYVRALLTNFHLPGSTLLMLVSAFGGYDLIREAYSKAIKEKYRFFSYGDAMLIL